MTQVMTGGLLCRIKILYPDINLQQWPQRDMVHHHQRYLEFSDSFKMLLIGNKTLISSDSTVKQLLLKRSEQEGAVWITQTSPVAGTGAGSQCIFVEGRKEGGKKRIH